MNKKEKLLLRLDAIGQSLAQTGKALALLGLGSVGQELERLDDYSDLDFFAIAQPGRKSAFIADLTWLSDIAPIAFAFQNTVDGYKLLFEDGIFCEFAVFEPAELAKILFPPGRVVWRAEGFDTAVLIPQSPAKKQHSREWLLGEALTNLYVGLGRCRRGEKLSAARFIQGYAVDRLLELAAHIETPRSGHIDAFDAARRFEQRFPQTARHLPQFNPGYENSLAAAQALDFLDAHFDVNLAMKRAIADLLVTPVR
ncbi:MAG: hypothetical protein GY803_23105 [Chloroflexi bacterium]|nr:hypothetical protein [Chloroflexota bacterium]